MRNVIEDALKAIEVAERLVEDARDQDDGVYVLDAQCLLHAARQSMVNHSGGDLSGPRFVAQMVPLTEREKRRYATT